MKKVAVLLVAASIVVAGTAGCREEPKPAISDPGKEVKQPDKKQQYGIKGPTFKAYKK